jgi:hypothetical protein
VNTERWRSAGLRLVAAGAVVQIAGLALDSWLHARDPSLAARESVVTLTNPGHSLFFAGLVMVVFGVALSLLGPRLARQSPRRRLVTLALPIALAGLTGTWVAVASPLDTGHVQATGAIDLLTEHGGEHSLEAPSDAPMDPATQRALEAQLAVARDVAKKFPDVATAEAAGYELTTTSAGPHYTRWDIMDDTFSVGEPEMLIAEGTNQHSRIIGLTYYVIGDNPPDGFAGPNDHWHRHLGECMRGHLIVAAPNASDWQCHAAGGAPNHAIDGWMLHVWLVAGWENPSGVFALPYPPRYMLELLGPKGLKSR